MGYEHSFRLSIFSLIMRGEDKTEEDLREFLAEDHWIGNRLLEAFSDKMWSEPYKGYEDTLDYLMEFTKEHPEVILILDSIGEDYLDITRAFIREDKYLVKDLEVIFPEPDLEVLKYFKLQ